MKVNQNPPNQSQILDKLGSSERVKSTGREQGNTPAPTLGSEQRGGVEISENARLMKTASEAVRSAPDVRRDRVDALKKQVQEGRYHVDAAAVADRLVDDHFQFEVGTRK